ncbi:MULTISPECIES: beta-N-acetylhexosaminidase [Paenibacillus]|uniref:beta-N-acetylhexosaminidase n=2 Tax=Paenibacillus violae TaxID=3077234 RepID=A0ABU3RH52_9BACL|nr:beta-N-acetylhexosaminidase [Paenibacillus anseongense]MDU0203616.1 beta-N-acetylhexosaminidase [Paenibacillus sp. PFR10]MEC0267549.1 beta-N-acetylhexosaminidase [Paenibacillus anseongense]
MNFVIPRYTKSMMCAAALSLFLAGCASSPKDNTSSAAPLSPTPSASAPAATPISTPNPTAAAPTPSPTPANPTAGLSLDEKLGQMILAGIDGYSVNANTQALISTYHVGGIILYKPNVKDSSQLVSLVNELKQKNAKNKLPLWIGVDEEGGRVTRLPEELQKTPTNQEIGKTNNKTYAYNIGNLIGSELRAYGLNVDFAPVLDINSNPKNPVIGDRSFGANAAVVNAMGIQEMKGLRDQQITSVVKHFPGHGDTSVDSHVGLPVVQNDLDRLRKLELIPFAEAFKQQADAVMVAHILLPKVDGQNPASMSKKIMTDLLRKEMGFQGVIMTDDMTMGAIEQNYDIGASAVKSVLAGANVIMVGHDYNKVVKVIEALRQAVQDKRIPMETIDQSVERIQKLKQKYKLKDESVGSVDVSALNQAVKKVLSSK